MPLQKSLFLTATVNLALFLSDQAGSWLPVVLFGKKQEACYQSRGVELGMLHHPIMSRWTAAAFHPLTTLFPDFLPAVGWPSIHPSMFYFYVQCWVLGATATAETSRVLWPQSAHLAGTARRFPGQQRDVVPLVGLVWVCSQWDMPRTRPQGGV